MTQCSWSTYHLKVIDAIQPHFTTNPLVKINRLACPSKQNSLAPPEDQVPGGGERGKTKQGDRYPPWFCPPLVGLLKSSLLLLLYPLMPFVYLSFNIEYSRTRLFLRVLLRRGSPNSKVRTVSRKPSQSRTVSSSGL